MEDDLREVTDVRELLSLANITELAFFKVSGERLEGVAADRESSDGGANLLIKVSQQVSPTNLWVRCAADVTTGDGHYVVDAAARYDLSEAVRLDMPVIQEFVEKVGIMAVYPFLREAAHASAAKLGLSLPMLGILRAGQVQLTPDPG